ncbi:Peptidase A1 [Macleaya cordata]|uniref:Peptidase A1 n=1 Tax=Macleaya cordata TaxID=56857 RepID=A0A200QX59_MACCD|nr:Peptidase A1 [Macleaya cordata]
MEQSKARIYYLSSMISGYNQTGGSISFKTTGFPVINEGTFLIAKVGIGTFNNQPAGQPDYKNYFLIVDTGSDLTWTQCENCTECFHQEEPYFPYKSSSSYQPLPCNNHPLCEHGKCSGSSCSYDIVYANDASSSGILASERFSLNADGAVEALDHEVIFGCGLEQKNFAQLKREEGTEEYITGILGIGGGPRSFLRQLRDRGQGKFEYCFQSWFTDIDSTTFIRFGSDVKIGRDTQEVHTTPLFFSPRTPTLYYLDLQDISVGNHRIGFEPGTFALKPNGKGGCCIDSGSPWTVIHRPKYDRLRAAVVQYFADLHMPAMGEGKYGFDLCFEKEAGFDNYPPITFHFERADFVIDNKDAGFFILGDYFCLAIHGWDDDFADALIGSTQQINHRILYDINEESLSFAKEECVVGA